MASEINEEDFECQKVIIKEKKRSFINYITKMCNIYSKIDIVISECSFTNSVLPWDNLYILHCIENSRKFLSNQFTILPLKFKLKAIAVELENLDKIRSPVGICEGFDISEFDTVILVSLTEFL
jgi:protein arginine N-methyltransferase 7